MEGHGPLFNVFIFLLAAVIAVPLAKRLGLGSVLGYLLAGVVIGPWGLALIVDPRDILHFAEFGVVLLLFLIGLELHPQRLWAMRRPILGLGGLQVLVTTMALGGAALLFGLGWRVALIAGMGLALSSTAIALQLLTERNLLPTPAGSASFSVLLFQDIAVIPMLAIIPVLAGSDAETATPSDWRSFILAVAVIGGIVAGGRFLTRPLLRTIAATRLRELFTAFSLLLVVSIALLMEAVGLSMALGTFLAGVLLADSEYRHALESDIEPFKGLLLGLFFIAVGMSVDFGLLWQRPGLVLLMVLGLLTIKAAVLYELGRWFGLPLSQQAFFTVVLSQGGEFAFVLLTVAVASGAMPSAASDLLVGVVALSMMTTPLLLALNERFIEPRFAAPAQQAMDVVQPEYHPVLIAGFGRFGQIVGRLLHANGVGTTVLDHDPEHIEMVRKFGFKVFFGDGTRLDLLYAAGAEQARVLVVAVDDQEQALRIVRLARDHFPNLQLMARAWDVAHVFQMQDQGATEVERESFEGALRLGERTLIQLGFTAWQAKQAAHQFRAHDAKLMAEIYQHFQEDLEVRAAISMSARARLREQMQQDEVFFGAHRDADWRSVNGVPAGTQAVQDIDTESR